MNNQKDDKTYKAAVFGMKGLIRILFLVLAAVAIVYLGKWAYSFGYALFREEAMEAEPGRDVEVRIPEEASAREVGKILEEAGLVKSASVFAAQERLSAYHGRIGNGTFVLNTSETPTEILAILSADTEEEGTS